MAFIQKASKYTNQERKDRLGKRREDSMAGPKKMSSRRASVLLHLLLLSSCQLGR